MQGTTGVVLGAAGGAVASTGASLGVAAARGQSLGGGDIGIALGVAVATAVAGAYAGRKGTEMERQLQRQGAAAGSAYSRASIRLSGTFPNTPQDFHQPRIARIHARLGFTWEAPTYDHALTDYAQTTVRGVVFGDNGVSSDAIIESSGIPHSHRVQVLGELRKIALNQMNLGTRNNADVDLQNFRQRNFMLQADHVRRGPVPEWVK